MSGYTVADHLVDRLAELGVDRVFGVLGQGKRGKGKGCGKGDRFDGGHGLAPEGDWR